MGNYRIFVAEDDSIILMGLKMILKHLGHTVVGEAVDGETAIERIFELKPQLLLLDINMPKKSGIEVLQTISQKISIPCIFLTAYSDENFIKEASRLGAVGYVIKPVTEEQLKAQIEISISQRMRLQQAAASAAYYKNALAERKLIERAKGILMDRMRLSESDAMKRLQKKSRDENKKLVTVAEDIIRADEVF